jgi:hypothetical protein
MYSVGILGDVRTHFFADPKARGRESATLRGGAYLTSALISKAVEELVPKPQVFACDLPENVAPDDLKISGDYEGWEFTQVMLELPGVQDSEKTRYRLSPSGNKPELRNPPRLSKEFAMALAENGVFPGVPAHKVLQTRYLGVPDILVLHDLGTFIRHWRMDESAANQRRNINVVNAELEHWHRLVESLQTLYNRLCNAREFAKNNHHFPQIEPLIIGIARDDIGGLCGPMNDQLLDNIWTRLLQDEWFWRRTILLLDVTDLRKEPLAISTGLSWERTAQDTIFAMRKHPRFRRLLNFGQVIVRYGVTGALHVVRRENQDWSYTLNFDPGFSDTTWTDAADPKILGNSSVFAASLIRGLTIHCNECKGVPSLSDLPLAIAGSIQDSLRACQFFSRYSYGKNSAENIDLYEKRWICDGLFGAHPDHLNGTPFAKQSISVPPVSLRTWSIVGQSIQVRNGLVARTIVQQGVDSTLNQVPTRDYPEAIVSPVVKFGEYDPSKTDERMIIVDRREIEGFRAVQKLMRAHVISVVNGRNKRPLSVAVFGPPGSGKSYAVRKIIQSLETHPERIHVLNAPFNLAQFTSPSNLDEAFAEIDRASKRGNVPIAFFDEFDSRLANEELGWLKLFLAPMEDGEFNKKTVTNAIFVFAGGSASNFSEFSLEHRATSDEQWLAFCRAKGPDFVSRLAGHLDIVGINPADADDELYLIRRAILIRAFLQEMQTLGNTDRAQIDDHMLRAVLHVPEYRHGGRAVRMLLKLCQDGQGGISLSAVPPIQQLNMLVDGQAFLDLAMNISADEVRPAVL